MIDREFMPSKLFSIFHVYIALELSLVARGVQEVSPTYEVVQVVRQSGLPALFVCYRGIPAKSFVCVILFLSYYAQ